MHKWILPNLSEILALSESTLANCRSEKVEWTASTQNCESDDVSPVRSTNQNVSKRVKAEREWCGAIAALEQLLLQSINSDTPSFADGHLPPIQGLVFAGPVPVLSHMTLLSSLQSCIFTTESLQPRAGTPFQLPPATATYTAQTSSHTIAAPKAGLVLPLLVGDPLASEQFCLVLTAKFSLVMVLGEDNPGCSAFLFSFEPEVVEQAWRSLRARVVLSDPQFPVFELDALVEQYHPVAPDYRTVMQFSRLLLKHLPELPEQDTQNLEVRSQKSEVGSQFCLPPGSWLLNASLLNGGGPPTGKQSPTEEPLLQEGFPPQASGVGNPPSGLSHRTQLAPPDSSQDVELLQAFAHEVRTPLTTIRTLTRLLLKRRDLAPDAIKRLEIIDHECTEQIDRMELLFRAAELQTSTVKHTSAHLTATSLAQVLQQSIPRWQKQASRRNLTLDVVLPQHLPTVVSDPRMLDQVLTGLIENFTRSLPAGSHIQVQVIPAGDQLKLQLLPQSQLEESGTSEHLPIPPTCKSLGQLLMFQPETGNISLNLTATKHLFQAIGGKLIVRHRPQQGEVLTIFLPMDVNSIQNSKFKVQN